MEDSRKNAYRYLLYQAMLDLRGLSGFRRPRPWYQRFNPWARRRDVRRVRRAAAVADWLHNLADYARRDFDRFDEETFWLGYDTLRRDHPDPRNCYREAFDLALSGQV